MDTCTCLNSVFVRQSPQTSFKGRSNVVRFGMEIHNEIAGRVDWVITVFLSFLSSMESGTQDALNKAGITHICQVFLWQCGVVSKAGTSVGKSLGFASSHFTFNRVLHSKFCFCSCKEHASLSVDYASTACIQRS